MLTRRTVIIAPGLVGTADFDSVLLQNLPSLRTIGEIGSICKIAGLPQVLTPEALYLGMGAHEAQLAPGPLTVAALGADPPQPSVHFQLTLSSVQDGTIRAPHFEPTAAELDQIWTAAERLNTRSLTLLRGDSRDHALVWEGAGEFLTKSPLEIEGHPLRDCLPEGDAEIPLRRLIDDSVNVLDDLELNHLRRDEGLDPFNLLWPWGEGSRMPVPNLALRRGEPAVVESSSLRMQGLSRLAGYRHGDRLAFGSGTRTRFEQIARDCLSRPLTVVLIQAPQELRAAGKMEELEWLAREMDDRLLKPLMESATRNQERLALLAPSSGTGLAVTLDGARPHSSIFPFDERTLDERSVPVRDLSTLVDESVQAPNPVT